jgi:hypothetical protein
VTTTRAKTGGRDIKPGQVLNPKGRPAIPYEMRQLMNARRSEIAADLCRLSTLQKHELAEIIRQRREPALNLAIAAVLLRGVSGDVKALNCILDRIVGRVKELKFSP